MICESELQAAALSDLKTPLQQAVRLRQRGVPGPPPPVGDVSDSERAGMEKMAALLTAVVSGACCVPSMLAFISFRRDEQVVNDKRTI